MKAIVNTKTNVVISTGETTSEAWKNFYHDTDSGPLDDHTDFECVEASEAGEINQERRNER